MAGVARARQKGRKPTGKKQGPRSTRASHSKSKTDRTTAHRSAQQFLTLFTAFCRARSRHRRHARQRCQPHGLNPAYTQCFARASHRQAKPQARAGDAEVPDLGSASRPSGEGRRHQGAAPVAKASRRIA